MKKTPNIHPWYYCRPALVIILALALLLLTGCQARKTIIVGSPFTCQTPSPSDINLLSSEVSVQRSEHHGVSEP